MRVPADQLLGDVLERIGHRETALVRGDLRQEDALEEEVADLAAQGVVIAAVDRVEHLVGLLEHERSQRLERLLAIPRAAVRPAKRPHDVDEALKLAPGGNCLRLRLLRSIARVRA